MNILCEQNGGDSYVRTTKMVMSAWQLVLEASHAFSSSKVYYAAEILMSGSHYMHGSGLGPTSITLAMKIST
jgi:hypothetical protein